MELTPEQSDVLDLLDTLKGLLYRIAEYKQPDVGTYARIRAELLVVSGLAG
jgi:hypothetical protein